MALRNLANVPKLCLVYFAVDKSTCVIETKKNAIERDREAVFGDCTKCETWLQSKVEASCWKLWLLQQVVSSVTFSDLFPDH